MSRRLLIFLVVVLFLIFVLLLMLNGRDDGSRSPIDLDAPNARQVRDWLTVKVKPEEIRVADENEDCRLDGRTFIVPENTRCTFAIQASTDQTKQIKLELAGLTLSIRLELAQDRALIVEEELLSDSNPLSMDIYRHKESAGAKLAFFDCVVPEPDEDSDEEKPPCRIEMLR